MSAILSGAGAVFAIAKTLLGIVQIFLSRLDEERRAKLIRLALEALKVKVDDEVIARAVRAFDRNPRGADGGLRGDPRDYRD